MSEMQGGKRGAGGRKQGRAFIGSVTSPEVDGEPCRVRSRGAMSSGVGSREIAVAVGREDR